MKQFTKSLLKNTAYVEFKKYLKKGETTDPCSPRMESVIHKY